MTLRKVGEQSRSDCKNDRPRAPTRNGTKSASTSHPLDLQLWFEKRSESDLGDRRAALVEKETGCVLVASDASAEGPDPQVTELMVARGGIEPPTRGFSVRCSTN